MKHVISGLNIFWRIQHTTLNNMTEDDYLMLGKVFTKLVVGGREFKASPHSKYSNKFPSGLK